METPSTSPEQRANASQKWVIWALVLGLPAVLLAFTGLAVAGGPQIADFTPTMMIYVPLIEKHPTPTFTPTPTATPTPIWTATPTQPPAPPGGSTSVSGNISLDLGKKPGGGTYATYCENVWFLDWFHNDDQARSLSWTIQGVSLNGPGMNNVFHTSWSNTNSWFTLYPNYYGPLNAPTSGGGQWSDAVSGPGHTDTLITQPGNFTLTEAVCLSSFNSCTHNSGTWHSFNSVTFTAVTWNPPPPQSCPHPSAQAMAAQPIDPLAGCHLDTSDPQNIRMVCPSK